MIIYLDILFMNNTLMTLAIIWAVAHLLDYETSWWRLILAALAGTLYTLVVLFIKPDFWFDSLKYIWHLGLNILTAILIIYFAFGKMSKKKYIKAVGYLYLVSFVTIGTTLSLFYIYGVTPFRADNLVFLILGLLVLVVIAKFGWKVFQKYTTPDTFYIPVTIFINNKEVEFVCLVDTGNSLNDPLTGVPVIIIEIQQILPIFSTELKKKISSCKGGIMDLVTILNVNGWGERLRILPFSALGQEHGMLIGIRPDKIRLLYNEDVIETERVILGLTETKLDDQEEYQGLIHPQIIN